jgi:hypothetical protein
MIPQCRTFLSRDSLVARFLRNARDRPWYPAPDAGQTEVRLQPGVVRLVYHAQRDTRVTTARRAREKRSGGNAAAPASGPLSHAAPAHEALAILRRNDP